MDPISSYLVSIGVSLASSAIYETIKRVANRNNATVEELKQELASVLNIDGAEVYAERLIQILAQNGNISITGTHLYANNSISMFSTPGHTMEFGNDSISETKNTKIHTKGKSKIIARGKAGIRQNDDGSISFYA